MFSGQAPFPPPNSPVLPTPTDLLAEHFHLPAGADRMGEDELLRWLAAAVDDLLRHRRAFLLSLCYTLDLDEGAVAGALDPASPVPANEALARLLYVRQCRRAATKQRFKPAVLNDKDAW